MATYRSSSVEETVCLGKVIGSHVQAYDTVMLNGDLGAGKTQLAKGFAAGVGVDDEVTSPTFPILVEYVGDELVLLHFDLYRLDEPQELEDIDFFGLLESGGVSLIEWGDKFEESLPQERLDVTIRVMPDETREIEIVGRGERGKVLEAEAQAALAGLRL